MVPTRELAEQVLGHLRGLVKYCESDISIVNVAGGVTAQLQRCAPKSRRRSCHRYRYSPGSCFPIGHMLLSGHRRRFSRCSRQRSLMFYIIPSLSDDPKTLSLSHLDSLVIDEADLILSYGHDEDIRSIYAGKFLPKVYQSFLMSATMTDDVETLKGLALRSPVRPCSRSYAWNSGVDASVLRLR